MKYCYDINDEGVYFVNKIAEEDAMLQGIETFDTFEEAQDVCNELNKEKL